MSAANHTILLIQYTDSPNSRTYMDFETLVQGIDGVCAIYESELKRCNPGVRNITYDVSDLYKYIDQLTDLSMLIYNGQTTSYIPRGKDWIKTQVFNHLKRQAAQ
jgi:hypothetical protein